MLPIRRGELSHLTLIQRVPLETASYKMQIVSVLVLWTDGLGGDDHAGGRLYLLPRAVLRSFPAV